MSGTRCGRCGFENPHRMKFCGGCGQPLELREGDAPRAGARESPQHRHMTVMFCDLVDSTPLAERLDAEDFREVLTDYRQVCLRAIERFGGYAALYAGDGVTVYFGYPRAHEDDAQRAVHVGLAILDDLGPLSARLSDLFDVSIQVRIGIHSGVVIAEELGGGAAETPWQLDVSGEMPHVAARLEAAAPPGSVVVSDATRELVEGYFETESLGAIVLKGVSRPIGAHRILRPTGAVGRLEVAASRHLTPLIGRAPELARLGEAWAEARAGRGRVVHLTGEAGIGKSRLVHELAAAAPAARLQRWQCSPHHQSTSLHPVTTFLEREFSARPSETADPRPMALERALADAGLDPAAVLPLLPGLIYAASGVHEPTRRLNPRDVRATVLQTLETLLVANPERHPLLLVVEDLHWADPTTVELLGRIVRAAARMPVLCVLTFRRDFHPPWTREDAVLEIDLGPLAPAEVRDMAAAASEQPLDADALDRLASTADGVPLFVEEMLKAGYPSQETIVPPTLQGLLTERLERLPELADVIDVAAILGREFDRSLLTAVEPLAGADLEPAFAQLAAHDVLRPVDGAASRSEFTHGLLQEAAYARMLRRRRRELHARVARTLVERFPEMVEREPELAARHWTAADEPAQAVSLWHRAGTRALERAAYREAADHFSRGLEALDAGGGDADGVEHIDFLTHIGASLQAGSGYAADGVEQAYSRARSACERVGRSDRLVPVIRGQWMLHLLRGEYAAAVALADEMLALGEHGERAGAVAEGHLYRGLVHMYLGAFEVARAHLEEAFSGYQPPDPADHVYEAQGDTGIGALAYLAVVLWNLGHAEESLDRSDRSLERVQHTAGAVIRAQAWGMRSILHLSRGEPVEMGQWVRRTYAHSVEHDLRYWRTVSSLLGAWLLGRSGDFARGTRSMEEGLAEYVRSGSRLGLPHFHILCADLYRSTGDKARALELLRAGEEYLEETGERLSESELFRFKGRLLAAGDAPDVDGAAAALERAVACAREQNARLLELQAVVRLAELQLKVGAPATALGRAAALCEWFGPSSRVPDVARAQALVQAESLAR